MGTCINILYDSVILTICVNAKRAMHKICTSELRDREFRHVAATIAHDVTRDIQATLER